MMPIQCIGFMLERTSFIVNANEPMNVRSSSPSDDTLNSTHNTPVSVRFINNCGVIENPSTFANSRYGKIAYTTTYNANVKVITAISCRVGVIVIYS